jgi:hypothetical protein
MSDLNTIMQNSARKRLMKKYELVSDHTLVKLEKQLRELSLK